MLKDFVVGSGIQFYSQRDNLKKTASFDYQCPLGILSVALLFNSPLFIFYHSLIRQKSHNRHSDTKIACRDNRQWHCADPFFEATVTSPPWTVLGIPLDTCRIFLWSERKLPLFPSRSACPPPSSVASLRISSPSFSVHRRQ